MCVMSLLLPSFSLPLLLLLLTLCSSYHYTEEAPLTVDITISGTIFFVQLTREMSAISVAIELCHRDDLGTDYIGNGAVDACLELIVDQIIAQRDDMSMDNQRYIGENVIVKRVALMPTHASYSPKSYSLHPCAGVRGEEVPICSRGAQVEVEVELEQEHGHESPAAAAVGLDGDGDGDGDANALYRYEVELAVLKQKQSEYASIHQLPHLSTSATYCPLRHSHLAQELVASRSTPSPLTDEGRDARGGSSSDSSSGLLFRRAKHQGAIAILAQAGQHSTYENRQCLKTLMETLRLLYLNYNDQFQDDIWIFHEGDFDAALQQYVRQGRREIRFFHLQGENWAVHPPFVRDQQRHYDNWSLGYHKMIRFFAIRIWHVMATMGYSWVWRMDDDSMLLSRIRYNVFAFMEHYDYDYAYRTVSIESRGDWLFDLLRAHVVKHGLHNQTSHLMDTCQVKDSILNFTFNNCGHTPGYYNNFFVANVTRWLQPDVQTLLAAFDDSGMIFLRHWGDAVLHSAAVRLLLDESRVHRFTGWGYRHVSPPRHQEREDYRGVGIIQGGALDGHAEQAASIEEAYRRDGHPASELELVRSKYVVHNDAMLTVNFDAPCSNHNYARCIC